MKIYIFLIISMLTGLLKLSGQTAVSPVNPEIFFESTTAPSAEKKRLFYLINNGNSDGLSVFRPEKFIQKANPGLHFMSSGFEINDIVVEKINPFSQELSQTLKEYISSLHKNEKENVERELIDSSVDEFMSGGNYSAILKWNITDGVHSKSISSVCVISAAGDILFDTELMNFTTGIRPDDTGLSEDNGSPDNIDAIVNQRSALALYSYWVDGTFGSVRHYNEVRVTGLVSPYITAATNDASFNAYTTTIISDRRNVDPLAPPTTPCVYFGEGGSVGSLYSNAVPYKSQINLTHTNDHFNTGIYNASGNNGSSISFNFDFQVSAGPVGLGITPVSNNPDITLSSSGFTNISMNHFLYYYPLGNTYRLLYYDGGSVNLSDFYILTGASPGETGSINVKIPLQVAYWSYLVMYNYADINVDVNLNAIQYVRGDHLKQPSFTLTSNKNNLQINDIDTLKLRVKNNSGYVALKGGSVSLDVSSLNNKLTLLSPGTIAVDSVSTNAFKDYKFIVRGNENGIVTPQATISSIKWGYPVPPSVTVNSIVTIDTSIDVSPYIKTITLRSPLQGFYNSLTNDQAADTIRMYLRSSVSPFAIVDSSRTVLNSNSAGALNFTKAVNHSDYYLELKHRNSITTWSKSPKQFVNSVMEYDFSTSGDKAFGDNLAMVDNSPITYALYGGDVNKDGFVNLNDVIQIYNNSSIYATGYIQADVTGDNAVNLNDILLAYNNSATFVQKISP